MSSVSVIMRTKDRPILLPRAVQSVLNQTHRDWELIIVNDGGEAAPVEALIRSVRGTAHGAIRVIHNPSAVGMEAASNVGLAQASGKYLVIHDDDDSWQPSFLQEMVAYLDHKPRPSIAGVVCHALKVSETVHERGVRVLDVADYNSWLKSVTLFRMAAENTFPPIAFLYERSVLDEISGYGEDLPVLGDWDFNLRFLQKFDIGVLPKPLANYHIRTSGKGVYGNTITDGVSRHVEYSAVLRNRYLRQDLANGSLGMGLLVNLAHDLHLAQDRLDNVQGRSDLLILLVKVMTGLLEPGARQAA